MTATLTNVGTAYFQVWTSGFYGTDPQDFAQTNNCPMYLTAGQSCQIQVTFTPTAKGNRTGSLYISGYFPVKTLLQGVGQ